MSDKNDFGYDVVDEVAKTGRYLTFKKGDKGRVIQIRLVSAPRYVNQHWVLGSDGKEKPIMCGGETCPYCGKAVPPKEKLDKTAKWGWIIIDREDGEVKMFTGPTLIARSIKDISELVDKKSNKLIWGNPLTFDIQIERTEEPGKSYYKVTPMPEGMGKEITEAEKEAVTKADIDLEQELMGSKESRNTGNYQNADLETAPDVVDVPEDLGETTEADDPNGPLPF